MSRYNHRYSRVLTPARRAWLADVAALFAVLVLATAFCLCVLAGAILVSAGNASGAWLILGAMCGLVVVCVALGGR